MDEVIKIENLTKVYKLYNKPSDRVKEALRLTKKQCYREHYALRNININISKGETVGIIGTNGSGKSTLLKLITGVISPTTGTIGIQGRISALLELGAGFNMEYTGIENVYLNGTMLGFTKDEIDQKLEEILSFADIGDFVYQPVKTYSSGMFVRLAFAVAINIEPEILIVDEALSVGDVFFQAKCFRKFEEFKKNGKTILFVTHDLNAVNKYCDRVILLNKGVKLQEGNPKEIIDIYKKILVNQNEVPENENNPKEEKVVLDNIVWKDKIETNNSCVNYGNGKAEINDYAIFDKHGNITSTLEKGTEFTIKVRVQFKDKVQDPIIAYTIKDLKGNELTGTNTMIEKVNTGVTKAGDVLTATFVQRLILQGGDYLISLGCTGFQEGNFVVYHRLYDVFHLNVISDKNTVGYFDMNVKASVD